MAFKVRMKQKVNIKAVVYKIIATVLALWVGGEILDEIGGVLNGTESPFYQGLSIIGYTVGEYPTNGSHWAAECDGTTYTSTTALGNNCISDTNGTGILSVVGIIGIASVVLEFVALKY